MRHSSVATTQVYTQLASGRTRSLVNLLWFTNVKTSLAPLMTT
jgi:site-specific recombinase XerD